MASRAATLTPLQRRRYEAKRRCNGNGGPSCGHIDRPRIVSVERREFSEPCCKCESRDNCRHRLKATLSEANRYALIKHQDEERELLERMLLEAGQ
jgi:hypothetical protein